jgi:hypothetical protein
MWNTYIINIIIHGAKSVRLERLAHVVCIMKWRWDAARLFIPSLENSAETSRPIHQIMAAFGLTKQRRTNVLSAADPFRILLHIFEYSWKCKCL